MTTIAAAAWVCLLSPLAAAAAIAAAGERLCRRGAGLSLDRLDDRRLRRRRGRASSRCWASRRRNASA